MLKVIDEKLIGTKKEAIEHFENLLNFINEEDHIQKVKNILDELKNCKKYNVEIYFQQMDDNFHIID